MAKLRIKLEEEAHVNNAYKTLFYGLKRNHEHNVAIFHPLAFLLRRVLYSMIIILMAGEDSVFFGALLLLFTCLYMLIFVAHEGPWENRMIN